MGLGRLGQYELLECLGSGGNGVVFRARDTRLGRIVALKVLRTDRFGVGRRQGEILREARAEAAFNHPNVATCYEIGSERPTDPQLLEALTPGVGDEGAGAVEPDADAILDYLAMEFVPGEDLSVRLAGNALGIDEILDIALQVTHGLEAAHAAGVIHRDLKPHNIRITDQGLVKILDFGLAHLRPTQIDAESKAGGMLPTERIAFGGTLAFMAPELVEGVTPDARSDLFSLGVILHQMVTGRLPFTGHTPEEIRLAMWTTVPQPMCRYARDVPEELQRMVDKLLARDPDDRYQSAHEVRTDLVHLRDQRAGVVAPVTHRLRNAVFSAASVLAALALAWWIWNYEPNKTGELPRNLAVVSMGAPAGLAASTDPTLGLTNAVAWALAPVPGLNAVASVEADPFDRPSPQASAGMPGGRALPHAPAGAGEVLRVLGVDLVLELGLHRGDGGTRVDARLVESSKGRPLWAGTYRHEGADLSGFGGWVVREVTHALSVELSDRIRERLQRLPTRSPAAYDLYLQGAAYLHRPSAVAAIAQATELLEKATALDPDFAEAHAALSSALYHRYRRSLEPRFLKGAWEAALRAVGLDPYFLDGRVALARILQMSGRYEDAETELRRVLSINPGRDDAYRQLSTVQTKEGNPDAAERSLRRALEIRPRYWRNWNAFGDLCWNGGRYAEARAAFSQASQLAPAWETWPNENLGSLELTLGNPRAALDAYGRIPLSQISATLASNMGTAWFVLNDLGRAEEYLRMATRLEPRQSVWAHNLGDLYTRRGEKTRAREQYETAVGLVEAELTRDPRDLELRLNRAVYLAKAGDCRGMRSAVDEFRVQLPMSAINAFKLAQAHAVCHDDEAALGALTTAVEKGLPPEAFREEDAFVDLAQRPEFQRLLRPESQ